MHYCVHYGTRWLWRSNGGGSMAPIVPSDVGDDHCATAPRILPGVNEYCSFNPGVGFSHDPATHTCRQIPDACAADQLNFFGTKSDCELACGASRNGMDGSAPDARAADGSKNGASEAGVGFGDAAARD
jgi:hypothetical protein